MGMLLSRQSLWQLTKNNMNMFKPTKATSVAEYIAQIEQPRREDVQTLHDFIQKIFPKYEVKLWGSIIGYGTYHYKYASGREGDWFPIGLASQKNYISVYVCAMDAKEYLAEQHKGDFPKASIGKSCIRFKKLSDIDLNALKKLLLKADKLMPSS